MSTPTGYVAYSHPSRYLELIGPLFERVDDPTVVGLRIDERHTNSRGFLHAGVLVAVADVLMGHTAHRDAPPGAGLVTASLTTDFPGSARPGTGSPAAPPPAGWAAGSRSPAASSTPATSWSSPPAACSPPSPPPEQRTREHPEPSVPPTSPRLCSPCPSPPRSGSPSPPSSRGEPRPGCHGGLTCPTPRGRSRPTRSPPSPTSPASPPASPCSFTSATGLST